MRILAHRGASGYAPENTFAAFDLACKMGARDIETDVRCTADGILVLHHDERVDRTTDGTGALAELTWRQLSRLDAGRGFSPEFAGQRIPRLDEFLARYSPVARLCLEGKGDGVAVPLARLLCELGYQASPQIELTSFEWETVLQFRALLPELPAGWLVRHVDANRSSIERLVQHGVRDFCPSLQDLTPELLQEAHRAGLRVRLWGLHNRDDYDRALASGADGATLNWPDWHKTLVAGEVDAVA